MGNETEPISRRRMFSVKEASSQRHSRAINYLYVLFVMIAIHLRCSKSGLYCVGPSFRGHEASLTKVTKMARCKAEVTENIVEKPVRARNCTEFTGKTRMYKGSTKERPYWSLTTEGKDH